MLSKNSLEILSWGRMRSEIRSKSYLLRLWKEGEALTPMLISSKLFLWMKSIEQHGKTWKRPKHDLWNFLLLLEGLRGYGSNGCFHKLHWKIPHEFVESHFGCVGQHFTPPMRPGTEVEDKKVYDDKLLDYQKYNHCGKPNMDQLKEFKRWVYEAYDKPPPKF